MCNRLGVVPVCAAIRSSGASLVGERAVAGITGMVGGLAFELIVRALHAKAAQPDNGAIPVVGAVSGAAILDAPCNTIHQCPIQ